MITKTIKKWKKKYFNNFQCVAGSVFHNIKEDGLLAGGPPCGPWIWINAATHCRKTWSIFGDTTKEYVAASNVYIWQYQSRIVVFCKPVPVVPCC